jgi:hypothetical protein
VLPSSPTVEDRHRQVIVKATALYDEGYAADALRLLSSDGLLDVSKEPLGDVLNALLLASRWYEEMGCTYAAKHHALVVVNLALRAGDSPMRALVGAAALQAVACDHVNGSFIRCLDFLALGVLGGDFHVSAANDQTNETIARYFAYGRSIVWHLRTQPAELQAVLGERLRLAAQDRTHEPPAADEPPDLLLGLPPFRRAPFADAQLDEEIVWWSLGVRWRIRWSKEHSLTFHAEELAALLQISIVDLARWDLCVVPTQSEIELVFGDGSEPELVRLGNAPSGCWRLVVPRVDRRSAEERCRRDRQYVLTILEDVSWRPDFMDLCTRAYKEGRAGTLQPVEAYSALYRHLVDPGGWARLPIGQPVRVDLRDEVHDELGWNFEPFRPQDRESPSTTLAALYQRARRGTFVSLPNWLELPESHETIAQLRDEGWLDCQILAGVYRYVLTHRLRSNAVPRELPDVDEPEDDADVPMDQLTAGLLRGMMYTNALLVVEQAGLTIRGRSPEINALRLFVGAKLGYAEDVPHADPFRLWV